MLSCASVSLIAGVYRCAPQFLSIRGTLAVLFSFTYNEIGIGESVEMKHLAQGHRVASVVFGLAFFWVHCRALVAFVTVLMG